MSQGRFSQFPSSLARQSRTARIGDVPMLLCHPDPEWKTPAPTILWMHGRTANKELDPGRYLRWIRAGLAACAIDLPGHGERGEPERQTPEHTLDVIEQAVGEVDRVVEHLADPAWGGAFDLERLAIGGMSMGGMVALRRLCDEHPFRCAAVEATTGDLGALYRGHSPEVEGRAERWVARHDADRVAAVDPSAHLEGWRPIPLLALHSEADAVIPVGVMRGFVERLRRRCEGAGAEPGLVRLHTWEQTGAPEEHIGFGRVSNDAKNMQTEFLGKELGAAPAG